MDAEAVVVDAEVAEEDAVAGKNMIMSDMKAHYGNAYISVVL